MYMHLPSPYRCYISTPVSFFMIWLTKYRASSRNHKIQPLGNLSTSMLAVSREAQMSSSAPYYITPYSSASIWENTLVQPECVFQLWKYLTLPYFTLMWFVMRERETFVFAPRRYLTVSASNRYHWQLLRSRSYQQLQLSKPPNRSKNHLLFLDCSVV
jgi:hypothetical protein